MNALRQRELEMAEKARSRALLVSAERRAEYFRTSGAGPAAGDRGAALLPPGDRRAAGQGDRDARWRDRAPHPPDGIDRSHARRRIGLDAARVLLLRAAAPMHDVGKIAHPGRRSCTSRGRSPPSERKRDGAPHDGRPPDPRRLRERAARHGGDDRPHPPRAVRRQRLPARPERRGHSARRDGSSRSPTSSTPCSATAATGRR